jgi:hypothetical protein
MNLHEMFQAHFLPVAASVTLSLPATMFLTVLWISEKSSNVVKGTFSFSQKVTRSGGWSTWYRYRHSEKREHTPARLGKKQIGLLGRRKIGHTVTGVEEDWPLLGR